MIIKSIFVCTAAGLLTATAALYIGGAVFIGGLAVYYVITKK